ncbi:hypothetical protein PsalMR5_00731 [Piscirickettsia salmonis]|nr:hypothetical protein PsalSR1_00733 [Piscirickettsia salmonis]QGP60757.1 hypothetical protein PsalBI1_03378 [Piscirickettsia salmonis]QGP62890.1 hypothetical protein PsalMR5_00731 [Piscirickettsia salmonis]
MPTIKFPNRQIFNDPTYFQDALRDSGRYHIFEVVAFIDRARRMQAAFIEAPYFPIEFSEISSGSYSLSQTTIGDLPELMVYLYDTFFSAMARLPVNLPDENGMLTQLMATPESIRRPSEMEVPALDLDFAEDHLVEMSSDDEEARPRSRVKGLGPSMVIRLALPNAQPSLAEVPSARSTAAKESPPLRAKPVLSPEVRSFSLGEIVEGQSITDGPSDAGQPAPTAQATLGLDLYGTSLTETSLPLSADSRAVDMLDSVSVTRLTEMYENERIDESRLSLQVHTSSLTESPLFLASVRRGMDLDGLASPLTDSPPHLAVNTGCAHVPSVSLTGITEESEDGGPFQARPKLDPTGRSLSSMAVEGAPPLSARRGDMSMSFDARFAALAGGGENLSEDEKRPQGTQPLPDVFEGLDEEGAKNSPSLSARMPKLSLANASSVSVTSVVVAKPFREVASVEELADFMTAALKHLTLPYQLKSARRREASSTLFADHAAEEEAAAALNPPAPDNGCCCAVL